MVATATAAIAAATIAAATTAVAAGLILIPLAALGFLSPVVAGAAMALSSVSVISNALLLKRWKLRQI